MTDPRSTDPRLDPNYPRAGAPYSDPAADPLITDRPIPAAERGRGGLIAAGVTAVLLVIALIAFNTVPSTDPGTTAVIPEQSDEAPATMDAPSAVPAAPETTAPATPAPAPEAAPAPAEPAAPAPAPAQ